MLFISKKSSMPANAEPLPLLLLLLGNTFSVQILATLEPFYRGKAKLSTYHLIIKPQDQMRSLGLSTTMV